MHCVLCNAPPLVVQANGKCVSCNKKQLTSDASTDPEPVGPTCSSPAPPTNSVSCSSIGCASPSFLVQKNGKCVKCNKKETGKEAQIKRKMCLIRGCTSPSYFIQVNGKCTLCNAKENKKLTPMDNYGDQLHQLVQISNQVAKATGSMLATLENKSEEFAQKKQDLTNRSFPGAHPPNTGLKEVKRCCSFPGENMRSMPKSPKHHSRSFTLSAKTVLTQHRHSLPIKRQPSSTTKYSSSLRKIASCASLTKDILELEPLQPKAEISTLRRFLDSPDF